MFNSKVQVDETVLDGIQPWKTANNLDKTPSTEKIKSVINTMANDKAPGQSGLMTDTIKNLLE